MEVGIFGTRIVLKIPIALFLLLSLSSMTWSQIRNDTTVGFAADRCSSMPVSLDQNRHHTARRAARRGTAFAAPAPLVES